MLPLLLSLSAQAADTSFHAAGYGFVNVAIPVDGDPASFTDLAFNPIFLWSEGDRILIENELEFEYGEEGLELALEYASIDIDLGGPMLVVGKFLTPTGQFVPRLHPSWINKLVDSPLPYRTGVLPMSHLGASLQHAVRIGDRQKVTGVLFVDNGPNTNLNGTPNLMPLPNNEGGGYGVGGRLGYIPMPGVEFGASGYTAGYDSGRYTTLVGDFSYTMRGVDIRGEYNDARWEGGTLQGAWAQAAWRLQQVDKLSFFEPVARVGWVQGDTFAESAEGMALLPIDAGGSSESLELGDAPLYEICIGANAYLRNNVVAKLSYVHQVEVYEPMIRLQLAFGY